MFLNRHKKLPNRIVASCAVTVVFGLLSCGATAGRPFAAELFLALVVVGYGASLIAVGRGLLDS